MRASNERKAVLASMANAANFLASGNEVEDLSNGQIGIFDADTGLSVDDTSTAGTVPDRVFFAVRHNGELIKSAGQEGVIPVPPNNNFLDTDFSCFQAATANVWTISNFNPLCNTTHVIKAIITVGSGMDIDGYQPIEKFFSVHTPPCEDCSDCGPAADCDAFVQDLADAINNDDDGLLTASVNTIADPDCDTLTVTADIEAVQSYCNIPEEYDSVRAVKVSWATVTGFNTHPTYTQDTPVAYGVGDQEDIKFEEYNAAGWQGRYQFGNARLTQDGHQYPLNSQAEAVTGTTEFFKIYFTYKQDSEGGMGEYSNNFATLVAINNNTDDAVTDPTNSVEAFLTAVDNIFGTDYVTQSQAC